MLYLTPKGSGYLISSHNHHLIISGLLNLHQFVLESGALQASLSAWQVYG